MRLAAASFGPAAKDLLRDNSLIRFDESRGRIFARLLLHEQDRAAGVSIYSDLILRRIGERLDVTVGDSNIERERFALDDSSNFKQPWKPVYESENDAFFVVGYGATRRVERLDRSIREPAPFAGDA